MTLQAQTLRTPVRGRGLIHQLVGALIVFSVFYMVAFPKGGIKLVGIPITIGYLLTALLVFLSVFSVDFHRIPKNRCVIILASIALSIWSFSVISENGFKSGGFTLSYFISIIYLPIFAMVAFSGLLLDRYRSIIEQTLLFAIRAIVVYGILLFIYRYFTGAWIEIPYLTINVDDAGSLDSKYIDRGGIFKLISTYNNGNIFGVSMLIVSLFYFRIEKRTVFRGLFFLALLLTLSRTVWIGLILMSLMMALSRGMRLLSIFYATIAAIVALLAIWVVLNWMGQDLSFLFDKNLGGRIGQVTDLRHAQWIPERPFRAIPEITYLGVIDGFGYVGLILFLVYFLSPIGFLYFGGTPLFSRRKDTACLQGLIIYAIVSMSDGAFSFIPVMMMYWMIAGLGLWYQREERRAEMARARLR